MGHRIALLVSGASGMLLPRHVLGRLAAHAEIERIHLAVSAGASQVLRHELGPERAGPADLVAAAGLGGALLDKVAIHRDGELDAPIASGSYRLTGTAILPCSAGTLGALATGSARTLIHRAGAVALKEGWPLVLGFRETPYSLVHVENMRRLLTAGATLLPPVPAFYIGGEDLGRFLDHYTLRLLDHLGIHDPGAPGLRWGEEVEPQGSGTP
ncbi:MAG TPA: UbiX family flavin prenyltransferase [Thermoanaerobaculia bacterium]|nr:UbiX family flavin prenyltransferase [Thermoanaerobaculia bacterium]